MRTHLLHTVPAIATEANRDTGVAANDDGYAPTARRPALLVATPSVAVQNNGVTTEHDDYYLGGYAGI
jgi:hypothetical protein